MPAARNYRELPPLDALVEIASFDGRFRRLDLGRIEEKLAKVREEHDLHTAAQTLEGTDREIASKLGIAEKKVLSWRRGGVPRNIGLVLRARSSLGDEVDICQENLPLAYLMGACLGQYEFQSDMMRALTFPLAETGVAQRIEASLVALFGVGNYIQQHKGRGRFYFRNNNFFKHLYHVTEGYTALPWEHLGTTEERKFFLEGLLDTSSMLLHAGAKAKVKGKSLALRKLRGERVDPFLEDVAHLLFRMGQIYPTVSTRGKGRYSKLVISDPDDARRLLEWGIVPERHREEMMVLASLPGMHNSLNAYIAVQDAKKRGKCSLVDEELALQEVRGQYGLSSGKFSYWVSDRGSTFIFKRWKKLRTLVDKGGPKFAIAGLYREGFSSQQARRLVKICAQRKDNALISDFEGYEEMGFSVDEGLDIAEQGGIGDLGFAHFALYRGKIPQELYAQWLSKDRNKFCEDLDEAVPLYVGINGSAFKLPWKALQNYFTEWGIDPLDIGGSEFQHHLGEIDRNLPKSEVDYSNPSKQKRGTVYKGQDLTFILNPYEGCRGVISRVEVSER